MADPPDLSALSLGADDERIEKQMTATESEPAVMADPTATTEPTSETQMWLHGADKGFVLFNPDFDAEVRANFDAAEAHARMIKDIDFARAHGNPSDTLCAVCEAKGYMLCRRCKHAKYCSRECQVADWPIHKNLCRDFAAAMSDANRPSPEHRRALFFPIYSTKPQLCWLLCGPGDGDIKFQHPDIATWIYELHEAGMAHIANNAQRLCLNLAMEFRSRHIGHMLVAFALADYDAVDGVPIPALPSHLNQSIHALSKPGYTRPIYGPLLLFADGRQPGEEAAQIRDVTQRDVHTFVQHWICYDCTCVADPKNYPGEVISGLKINNLKWSINVALGIESVFESVKVPLGPIHRLDFPIVMAFHLGLHWYMRAGNFLTDPGNGSKKQWLDANLRYLSFVCGIRRKEVPVATTKEDIFDDAIPYYEVIFRYAPFFGSVLILHGSGEPVDVHHVLAFNAYLDSVCVTKGVASKEGFQQFWAAYKNEKGGPVSSVPSPYKWEKKGVRDRLGFYAPEFIMEAVRKRIDEAWWTILQQMND